MDPLTTFFYLNLTTMAIKMPYSSVTVMIDNSITDKQGFVHAWLVLVTEAGTPKWFSFTKNESSNALFASPGKSSVDEELKKRIPSSHITFLLDKLEAKQIEEATDKFYDIKPMYMAVPPRVTILHGGVFYEIYNCVTAMADILTDGGIYEFLIAGVLPKNVEKKINSGYWKFIDSRIVGLDRVGKLGTKRVKREVIELDDSLPLRYYLKDVLDLFKLKLILFDNLPTRMSQRYWIGVPAPRPTPKSTV